MAIHISKQAGDEPAVYSVVIDSMGDAWQRGRDGLWGCALGDDTHKEYTWRRLQAIFGPCTFIHNGLVNDLEDVLE